MGVINACAAATLLEQRPEKIQALNGIRTHDHCDAGTVLSQLSYQSHIESGRIRVGPLYVDVILGPSIVKSEINFVHSSNGVMTVINESVAATLPEQRPEKIHLQLCSHLINFALEPLGLQCSC